MSELGHFKDRGLDRLATDNYNVAQFVSFDNDGVQRFSRTKGNAQNHEFESQESAAQYLLSNTTEQSVNVRSFDPADPKSKPFDYGLTSIDDVLASLNARRNEGLHTILNETVDIDDGGVSGVAFGNVIEFSPHDTPRCVEKPGTVQFTRAMGSEVIKKVYGFSPTLAADADTRLEFSIHPLRHGYRDAHTIIWEAERADGAPVRSETAWPNRFSDMLGDKTFGLIIADQIGLAVPQTVVFNRTVAPFTFGRPTGSQESWLRTAPNKQTPGLYTTTKGWIDPYELMAKEDPTGKNISSILRQDGIDARFSGAVIMGNDGKLLIEGTSGFGDNFMVGEKGVVELPHYLTAAIKDVYDQASTRMGPVRFEWVYDGTTVWVVQLHRGISASAGETIYSGNEDTVYTEYDTRLGIDGLRELIANNKTGGGIVLKGNVGITSHFGDLLRKAQIPSRIERDNG
jgi:hypothetical protein